MTILNKEVSLVGRLITEPSRGLTLLNSINPDVFDHLESKQILKALKDYRAKYGSYGYASIADAYPLLPWDNYFESGKQIKLDDAAAFYAQLLEIYDKENKKKALQTALSSLDQSPDYQALLNSTAVSLLAGNRDTSEAESPLEQVVSRFLTKQGTDITIDGYSTGYQLLDTALNGLQKSTMTVIASRPSIGKTTLLLNCHKFWAENHIKSVMFSFEMTPMQIISKYFLMFGWTKEEFMSNCVPENRIKTFKQLVTKVTEILKYITFDNSQPGPDMLHGKCLDYLSLGCQLFSFDYLQKIPQASEKMTHPEHVGKVSGILKKISTDLDIPIIAAAQLNRESRTRANKRPILEDLRETGNIEQDADNVIMVHREKKYHRETEIIMRKIREGEADKIIKADYCLPHQIITEVGKIENEEPDSAEDEFEATKGNRRKFRGTGSFHAVGGAN